MKTIRGKILVYFLVFVVLFQITAISIYVSSNELMNTYDESFQRFLRLNAISQKSDELYARTKILIVEPEAENETAYMMPNANWKRKRRNLLLTSIILRKLI